MPPATPQRVRRAIERALVRQQDPHALAKRHGVSVITVGRIRRALLGTTPGKTPQNYRVINLVREVLGMDPLTNR